MPAPDFDRNVFVNCPFDAAYEPVLQALLFCLLRFGLKPRIATERSDAGETRLSKIQELIAGSRYSIHDLSRCQAVEAGEYARLNMPFELGLDIGCRVYGGPQHATKTLLVLEEQRYRYQIALSDMAGCDIQCHEGRHDLAVRKLRNWITSLGGFETIGAGRILSEYEDFQEWYLEGRIAAGFTEEDLRDVGTNELLLAMIAWNEQGRPVE